MSYQLISLDMDGTLLNSKLQISDENIRAIHNAVLHHKNVVIATGRSLSEMNPYMQNLKDVRYFVLESGAVVYDKLKEKIIYQKFFSAEDVRKIVETADKQDIMPQYFSDGYSYTFLEKMLHMDKYNMAKFQQFYLDHVERITDFDQFIKNKIHRMEKIIFYHQSLHEVEECYQLLKDIHVEKPMVGISIEMSPAGVNKATGLRFLCQKLNLDMKNVIAVGDSDNDIEILKSVGLAIGVKNANEHVKHVCDVTVSNNDNNGVAQAIEQYLIGSNMK